MRDRRGASTCAWLQRKLGKLTWARMPTRMQLESWLQFLSISGGRIKCYLGKAEILDAIADVAEPVFGGQVAKIGFQCPSINHSIWDLWILVLLSAWRCGYVSEKMMHMLCFFEMRCTCLSIAVCISLNLGLCSCVWWKGFIFDYFTSTDCRSGKSGVMSCTNSTGNGGYRAWSHVRKVTTDYNACILIECVNLISLCQYQLEREFELCTCSVSSWKRKSSWTLVDRRL